MLLGFKACPNDASSEVENIIGIEIMERNGGDGCVRE